jgi:hypothetical protein
MDQGMQCARLEGRDLNQNWYTDRRAWYWYRLREDLILGGHEETKVEMPVYKRLYKECKGINGNSSEREQTVPLNTLSTKTLYIQ